MKKCARRGGECRRANRRDAEPEGFKITICFENMPLACLPRSVELRSGLTRTYMQLQPLRGRLRSQGAGSRLRFG